MTAVQNHIQNEVGHITTNCTFSVDMFGLEGDYIHSYQMFTLSVTARARGSVGDRCLLGARLASPSPLQKPGS